MYERKRDKLLPFPRFLGRIGLSLIIAAGVAASALLIGTVGYHVTAGLTWLDAELNAAMILTGMGPVDALPTPASKVFASAYAMLSGLVFLSAVGIILAPVFHRIIHKFHLEDEDGSKKQRTKEP